MTVAQRLYHLFHPKAKSSPYYLENSITSLFLKPIRKFFVVSIIPCIPFTSLRIFGYKLFGFKIGKHVFIGMRCYFDDYCYDKIIIEDNCTISYGVYFACHGIHQPHNLISIKKGAYIGTRTTIIAPKDIEIGENAIIGAASLVNKSIPEGQTWVGVPAKQIPNKDQYN